MYHVTVSAGKNVIAENLYEGLGDSVLFGRSVGQKGNRITIYESVQDSSGEIVHISEVLSVVLTEHDEPK